LPLVEIVLVAKLTTIVVGVPMELLVLGLVLTLRAKPNVLTMETFGMIALWEMDALPATPLVVHAMAM